MPFISCHQIPAGEVLYLLPIYEFASLYYKLLQSCHFMLILLVESIMLNAIIMQPAETKLLTTF